MTTMGGRHTPESRRAEKDGESKETVLLRTLGDVSRRISELHKESLPPLIHARLSASDPPSSLSYLDSIHTTLVLKLEASSTGKECHQDDALLYRAL
jgi:hypothetical protein